jgi:hypothetical protein
LALAPGEGANRYAASVDRHDACRLLSEILERYRSLPFSELAALVGSPRSERVRTESGEEFLLTVVVEWVDESARRLRVAASADSPSRFRLEHHEERITLSGEAV